MAAPTEKGNTVVAIVYDFETGGLDFAKSAATQISLHAVRLDTFEVIGKYQAYIYPYHYKENMGKPKRKTLKSKYDDDVAPLMEYSDKSMQVSGLTMDILYQHGKPLETVCTEICDFIENNTLPIVATHKPFMVGQNPSFDKGFMQQIMLYAGLWGRFTKLVRGDNDFWGNFQPTQLDTIILSQLALNDDKSFSSWRLEAVSEKLGIDLDDAHDADADVTATREVVRILTARMRDSNGDGNAVGSLSTEKKDKLRNHFKI